MTITEGVAPAEGARARRRGVSLAARTHERTASWYPDLDVVSIALGMELVQAAHLFGLRSEQAIHRPRGQNWLSFRILFLIWLMEPMSARDVVRYTEVSRQTTSHCLQSMERDGLIRRERDRADQRLITIRLTPSGRTLAEDLVREQLSQEMRWFEVLSAEERRTLVGLLVRVRAAIAANPHVTDPSDSPTQPTR